MNVGEMHLAIQQGVDKINSFQADMLLPQELDLELNQAQYKFINTKYGRGNKYQKGFEQGQKRIDDIRTLIKEASLATNYKGVVNSTTWSDSAVLPDDYMYLVNTRAHLQRKKTCIPLTEAELLASLSFINSFANFKYFELPMDDLIGSTLIDSVHGLYMVADVSHQQIGGTYPPILQAPQYTLWDQVTTTPLDGTEAGVAAFKAEIEAGVIGSWWGEWQDLQSAKRPGGFLLRIHTATYPANNSDPFLGTVWHILAIDGNGNELYRAPLTTVPDFHQHRLLENTPLTAAEFERVYSIAKFVQQDDIYSLLDDPFNTTKWEQPLYTIRENRLDFYTNDIFIIPEVKLTYIRKPAEISLSLQVSCELPEHSHREIVDMAVSSILETIADSRYKTHEIEVNKNE